METWPDERQFFVCFSFFFFSSFLLRQSFSVCKSNWRQGWTRTQRDAPACSFPHRTRINSMQQTTDSSFGIYSPLGLHLEKLCPYSLSPSQKKGLLSCCCPEDTHISAHFSHHFISPLFLFLDWSKVHVHVPDFLDFTIQTSEASWSQKPTCHWFLNPGIKGVVHKPIWLHVVKKKGLLRQKPSWLLNFWACIPPLYLI